MEAAYNTLKIINEFEHAAIYLDGVSQSVIIRSKSTYIPIEEFQKIFNFAETLIKEHKINKTIFDKRSLKVFHQPSMQWYFTEWKERLFGLGIKKHIKILPDDFVFKSSVKIGRDKIDQLFPNALYHQTSIVYAENLAEALKI